MRLLLSCVSRCGRFFVIAAQLKAGAPTEFVASFGELWKATERAYANHTRQIRLLPVRLEALYRQMLSSSSLYKYLPSPLFSTSLQLSDKQLSGIHTSLPNRSNSFTRIQWNQLCTWVCTRKPHRTANHLSLSHTYSYTSRHPSSSRPLSRQ